MLQKKSAWRSRPIKSAQLISQKNVFILRETGWIMMMRKKEDKRTKKQQQSPKKVTTAKRSQAKRAARFNEEITVVVIKYLRDLHA